VEIRTVNGQLKPGSAFKLIATGYFLGGGSACEPLPIVLALPDRRRKQPAAAFPRGGLMKLRSWSTAMALALGMFTVSNVAHAQTSSGLNFCNKTAVLVGVAVGYHSPGVNDPPDHSILTGPFVSRGWWAVEPGKCQTIENPFNARYMFWSDYQVLGGWGYAETYFCRSAGPKAFTFEDENESLNACQAAGKGVWVPSHKVDTAVDATVNFTGADTQ
jgi:uncharacterized membrane protein